jgi:hypothetical protein
MTYLRIPKVHRLVHELVDEGHVVPHGVLVKVVPEVGLEDLDELEDVLEDEGRVDVGPSEGDKVHVPEPRVEEAAVLDPLDGGLGPRLLGGNDLKKMTMTTEAR